MELWVIYAFLFAFLFLILNNTETLWDTYPTDDKLRASDRIQPADIFYLAHIVIFF